METAFNAEAMRIEKRGVAKNSVYAAVLITGLKFVVGVTTGSELDPEQTSGPQSVDVR